MTDDMLTENLTEGQIATLEAELGTDLTGIKTVADDTQDYFIARAVEEGLTADEMLTCINAVDGAITEDYVTAVANADGRRVGPVAILPERVADERAAETDGPEPAEESDGPEVDVPDDVPKPPMASRAESVEPSRTWDGSDGDDASATADEDGLVESAAHAHETDTEPSTDGGAVRTTAHDDADRAHGGSLVEQATHPVTAYGAALGGAVVYFASAYVPVTNAGLYATAALALLAFGLALADGLSDSWGESA